MTETGQIAVEGSEALKWSHGLSAKARFIPWSNVDKKPGPVSVIISDQISILETMKAQHPSISRVWLLDRNSPFSLQLIRQSLEKAQIFQVVRSQDEEHTILALVAKAAQMSRGEEQRRQWLAELRLKNQQLEELTAGLETAVTERTQVAANSKTEVETKLAKINEVIQFVNELSFQREIEDLLLLLRKEVRHFHGALDPVLVCAIPTKNTRVFYLRAGTVIERESRGAFPGGTKFRSHHQTDSQYLANELGRPFGRVIFFPLLSAKGGIFFEHSMDLAVQTRFVASMSERLQAIGLALDRILLESELKAASSLWEQTFDGIEEPVAVVDQNFRLLRANKYFSSDLILGRCHSHFAKSVETCQGCPLPQSVQKQTSTVGQVRRERSIYEVHSYPIYMENDHAAVSTFVNHYVDVTKSLALQGQLVQSEKMVALGHLAGHIAHELNNPLSGIRSLSQILLRTLPQDTTLATDLSEVEKAATRCQRIIENLLEFSRDRETQALAIIDLNDVLKKTLPLLKTAMGAFTSDVEFADQPVFVRASSQLLQQVVFNLVVNACQAMADSGSLLLKVLVVDEWAELVVQDSGVGIPVEFQDRIFEPFFTTKESGLGTGLGLSMCRDIVESFRGRISFESVREGGTRFSVRLPLQEPP